MADIQINPWNETPLPDARPAHVYARDRDWPGYFRALAHLGPRETLLKALASFDAEPPPPVGRLAIDLGCGDGRDTAELLRRGWRVIATDGSAEGIERLLRRNDLVGREHLRTRVSDFANVEIPPCDLVCASFSLPFCEPKVFPVLWRRIVSGVQPGGRFAGQLFGDRDDWASLPDRTHHSPVEARDLFREFEIEHWQEECRQSTVDPTAHPKAWHVFHIVARKNAEARNTEA